MSVIANGFSLLLPKRTGFGYGVIGAVGNKDEFYSLYNEEAISKKTESFLKQNKNYFSVLKKSQKEANIEFKKINSLLKKNSFASIKKAVCVNYVNYMSCLGVFNCFWKYVGNEKQKEFLNEKQVKDIANMRQKTAELYPKINSLLEESIKNLKIKTGQDISCILSMTVFELKNYSPCDKASCLEERNEGYVYFIKDKTESVITGKKIIETVKKEFIEEKVICMNLTGKGVSLGKASGRVRIVKSVQQVKNFCEGEVLVSINTSIELTPAIKKASAVLTEEGGIMSHAAIIARELKIPCIVGVKAATRVLKDGDLVEVDANKGVIRKVS